MPNSKHSSNDHLDFDKYQKVLTKSLFDAQLYYCEQTSSAELGVGTPFVSGSLKVANPANPDKIAKIMNVPFLKWKWHIQKETDHMIFQMKNNHFLSLTQRK